MERADGTIKPLVMLYSFMLASSTSYLNFRASPTIDDCFQCVLQLLMSVSKLIISTSKTKGARVEQLQRNLHRNTFVICHKIPITLYVLQHL